MGTIELRAFGALQKILSEEGYSFPTKIEIEANTTGYDLIDRLKIDKKQVEAVFINGLVEGLSHPIAPGDRVALLPPGTPGPYRVFLGIIQKKET
ncbi:MoaD/ThiS family protein [Desulfotomaculum sp. 1211_IL3151]|uniref:MoaD/ThiS family protein n=1 Tax=Desulfotomaculum sp. 1211_IL3151 TaxID=3084055 RepID=UPI002FDA7050